MSTKILTGYEQPTYRFQLRL